MEKGGFYVFHIYFCLFWWNFPFIRAIWWEKRKEKKRKREDFCFASTLLLTTWCSCVFWPKQQIMIASVFSLLFLTPPFSLLQDIRENEGVLNWRRAAAQQRGSTAAQQHVGKLSSFRAPPPTECLGSLLLFSAGGSLVIIVLFTFVPLTAKSNIGVFLGQLSSKSSKVSTKKPPNVFLH